MYANYTIRTARKDEESTSVLLIIIMSLAVLTFILLTLGVTYAEDNHIGQAPYRQPNGQTVWRPIGTRIGGMELQEDGSLRNPETPRTIKGQTPAEQVSSVVNAPAATVATFFAPKIGTTKTATDIFRALNFNDPTQAQLSAVNAFIARVGFQNAYNVIVNMVVDPQTGLFDYRGLSNLQGLLED